MPRALSTFPMVSSFFRDWGAASAAISDSERSPCAQLRGEGRMGGWMVQRNLSNVEGWTGSHFVVGDSKRPAVRRPNPASPPPPPRHSFVRWPFSSGGSWIGRLRIAPRHCDVTLSSVILQRITFGLKFMPLIRESPIIHRRRPLVVLDSFPPLAPSPQPQCRILFTARGL